MSAHDAAVERTGFEIAVIGMAGRFPGARTVDALWRNLRDGVESITFFSDEELDPWFGGRALLGSSHMVKARAVLDDVELFDAQFFGYSPRDAAIIDPQQRLFLECAWEALEAAGHVPGASGGPVGVYAGSAMSTYLIYNLLQNREVLTSIGNYQAMLANDKDFLATRTAYKLGLEGPAIGIQTACSTSLVAVHLACQGLLSGDCDVALAGGVSIALPQNAASIYREGGIASPDGHCRPFDVDARGTVGGSGLGIVALKRLDDALRDANPVRAIIRGSAVSNDGSHKVGFTAPSAAGQARAIEAALLMAEVAPEKIGYVEGHGTGTPLGDPIEVEGLARAYGGSGRGTCALGSIKGNLGHLDAAAGVAGLIKTVLALEHGLVPPTLHFAAPNPALGLEETPFFVPDRLTPWPQADAPRRAAVSSFGIGGTNAHVVLEQAPVSPEQPPTCGPYLLTLSAQTATALDATAARLGAHLEAHPTANLDNVAFTLHTGRREFAHRRAVVCRDVAGAVRSLGSAASPLSSGIRSAGGPVRVAFLFPGQGTQRVGMGRGLYETESVFRDCLDHCARALAARFDLLEVLFADDDDEGRNDRRLRDTRFAQPALFAVEYALAELWGSFGVTPVGLAGHSVGEFVAACRAGVFSLDEALDLVAYRGELVASVPPGAMVGVALAEAEAGRYVRGVVGLAAVNGPQGCVLSGPVDAIEAVERELAHERVAFTRLRTSHAFHSPMMEPVVADFASRVATLRLAAPTTPFVSNLTGTWITDEDARSPAYWGRHLRGTVRFADVARTLLAEPTVALLEVGPGRTLAALAAQAVADARTRVIVSTLGRQTPAPDEPQAFLSALGRLWCAGVDVSFEPLRAGISPRLVALPTYPFERVRHWVDPVDLMEMLPEAPESGEERRSSAVLPRPELEPSGTGSGGDAESEVERALLALWRELLGIETVTRTDDFFELGGHSLLAMQLLARIQETVPLQLPLETIFTAPTVAELARVVEEKLLDLIERLPDDEAERLAAVLSR